MPRVETFGNQPPRELVASIGGSKVHPEAGINQDFVDRLVDFTKELVDRGVTPVWIIGGGSPAREVKQSQQDLGVSDTRALDETGIIISELNATIVTNVLKARGLPVTLITRHDQQKLDALKNKKPLAPGQAYVFSGLDYGQTTDTVAAMIALATGQCVILNISNTEGVHPVGKDGSLDTQTVYSYLSLKDYLALLPTTDHVPSGSNPIDPVAAKMVAKMDPEKAPWFVLIGGADNKVIFDRWRDCLAGREFTGTVIRP